MSKKVIYLLPGFDGSGKFFTPLVNCLAPEYDVRILSLPTSGSQDYASLAGHLSKHITERGILLAESFSGPIAIRIASLLPNQITSLFLVATFWCIESRRVTRGLLSLLAHSYAMIPFRTLFIRALLLNGWETIGVSVSSIDREVKGLPIGVVKERLKAALSYPDIECPRVLLPVHVIHAQSDRLLRFLRVHPFRVASSHMYLIEGPHLLAQVNPEEVYNIIRAHS